MQQVLKNVSDDRLRAYIVWLPILWSDSRASAERRSAELVDPRVTYFWDGKRVTGQAWQRALNISGVAWDVYFLYDVQTRWEKGLTRPDFWMHQLSTAEDKAPYLDAVDFEAKLKEMLGTIKPSALVEREGVKSAEVRFKKKQAFVRYDSTKVSPN